MYQLVRARTKSRMEQKCTNFVKLPERSVPAGTTGTKMKLITMAVPSTLHQKIKFVTEGKLVYIFVEEDMIVATSSGAPYMEANERAMKCSFRSLEFVNVMYVKEGAKIPTPKLSKVTHLGIK